jgi:gamma-glutamylcyclotransferase (GGCT)/AIG2-like uncharacterized protein YtfP
MRVFVYGTLTDPDRAAALLDTFAYRGDWVLDGLHRVDGTYPTLAPGGKTRGRILRTTEIDVLDEYEGVERGLYVRVPVSFADDTAAGDEAAPRDDTATDNEEVAVYVGDPDALGAAGVSWPDSGSFRDCVGQYIREEAVCIRRE